jgi:hypothetical protein
MQTFFSFKTDQTITVSVQGAPQDDAIEEPIELKIPLNEI